MPREQSDERKIYRLRSDCLTLDTVFLACTDDGRFVEGWVLSVGFQGRPELRYATYSKANVELIELLPSRLDEARQQGAFNG